MANVTIPLKIEFKTWASQIIQDLPSLNMLNPPDSIEGWREWAAQTIQDNNLYSVPLPDRIAFPKNENWVNWAVYFVDSVYNT